MGTHAMSTMIRKKTLQRQESLARSTMGESIKIDSTRGTALATSEYMGVQEDTGLDLRRKF